MKRLLLFLLVIGGAIIGGSYYLTGRLPWVELSVEEQQIALLRGEFSLACQQWRQAGRAGSLGMDTSSMTDTPVAKLEQLEKSLAELIPTLKTSEARLQAGKLRRDITAFKGEMR